MANIKSSKKDVISSKIAYEKNKANKSVLKTTLKKFEAALAETPGRWRQPLPSAAGTGWTCRSRRFPRSRSVYPFFTLRSFSPVQIATNLGRRIMRPIRRGSFSSRYSHSRLRSIIHRGARWATPA